MFSPLRSRAAIFGSRSLVPSRPILQATITTPIHHTRFNSSSSSSNKPPTTADTVTSDPTPFPDSSSGETRGISGHAESLATGEETNATPVDHWGIKNEPLIETAEQARAILSAQAPNRMETWSKSQRKRSEAMTGPRFEQTIMETQVSSTFLFPG